MIINAVDLRPSVCIDQMVKLSKNTLSITMCSPNSPDSRDLPTEFGFSEENDDDVTLVEQKSYVDFFESSEYEFKDPVQLVGHSFQPLHRPPRC